MLKTINTKIACLLSHVNIRFHVFTVYDKYYVTHVYTLKSFICNTLGVVAKLVEAF